MHRVAPTSSKPFVVIFTGVVAVLLVVVSGCGGDSSTGDSSGESSGDTFVVGTDPAYGVPFVDESGSEWTGYNPEVWKAIAARIGKSVEFEAVKDDSLVASLKAKRIDVADGGYTENPEHREQMELVDLFVTVGTLVVPPGNPDGFASYTDLCGYKLVYLTGALGFEEQIEKANEECPAGEAIDVLQVGSDAALTTLKSGQADVYLTDNLTAAGIEENNEFEAVSASDAEPFIASSGVRKTEAGLATELAEGFQELIESGEIEKFAAKWKVPLTAVPDEATVNDKPIASASAEG